jgi:hypothetical protein
MKETSSIRGDEDRHRQRRAAGHEQREEVQPVLPEADDQHDREAHDRQHAGDGEVAGEGEGMHADQTQRHQAEQVGEQDEHEQREDVGHILAPGLADVGFEQVVDEAGQAFDRHLPATGHQLALHAAGDEHPAQHSRNRHPQRGIGEGDVEARRFASRNRTSARW